MIEITVGLCESFRAIGINISEADLRKFERALYEHGLNVAPLSRSPATHIDDCSGSQTGTGSAYYTGREPR